MKLCIKLENSIDLGDDQFADMSSVFIDLKENAKSLNADWIDLETRLREFEKLALDCDELSDDKIKLERKLKHVKIAASKRTGFYELYEQVSAFQKLHSGILSLQTKETELVEAVNNASGSIDSQALELLFLNDLLKGDQSNINNTGKEIHTEKTKEFSKLLTELTKLENIRDRLGKLEERQFVTAEDVSLLEAQYATLQPTIDELTLKLQNAQACLSKNSNEKMLLYYQQYRIAFRKRDDIEASLQEAQSNRQYALNRLKGEEAEFEARTGSRFISEEDLAELIKTVRQTTAEYKELKNTVTELNSEHALLENTARGSSEELIAFERTLDLNKEPVNSEKVKGETERLNQTKEQALEEMATVVTELNSKLKEKRAVLGPKMIELKSKREKVVSLCEQLLDRESRLQLMLAPITVDIYEKTSELKSFRVLIEKIDAELTTAAAHSESIGELQEIDDPYEECEKLQSQLKKAEFDRILLAERVSDIPETKSISEIRVAFATVSELLGKRIHARNMQSYF
jgi:chromosome segregation ATPase